MRRVRFDPLLIAVAIGAAALGGCERPAGNPTPPAPAPKVDVIDPALFVAGGAVEEGIRRETTVKAPVREVFAMLTTEAGLKKVMLVDSKVDLRIGGPWELYFNPKNEPGDRGSEGSRILTYVPNRMFSVAMSAPGDFPEERRKRTWIVITFDPIGDNETFVRLTHLGFGEGGKWNDLKQYFERSWGAALRRLAETYSPPQLPKAAAPPNQPR